MKRSIDKKLWTFHSPTPAELKAPHKRVWNHVHTPSTTKVFPLHIFSSHFHIFVVVIDVVAGRGKRPRQCGVWESARQDSLIFFFSFLQNKFNASKLLLIVAWRIRMGTTGGERRVRSWNIEKKSPVWIESSI